MKIKTTHKETCHCGSVVIDVTLPNGLEDPRRCNCSMCRRRGAIAASVPLDGIKIIKGENFLTLYQFNTMTAKHESSTVDVTNMLYIYEMNRN